ncbi:hypothetical protein K504DRAFT_532597 [Pleomassaria siparia CBS 279.74]|uniref:Uncharacterized protein n=1 Tax=Pleomassaria siparia CBS 279.74 TaxID=1314801 RepID=A0A6G1KEI0_9PLEO|nr:hypothetical protein K504DRAFT_532597 [Pleomassaria siparia CBS 279.74]
MAMDPNAPFSIVHVEYLISIRENLDNSEDERDIKLSKWINQTYFNPAPAKEALGLPIQTPEAFHFLFQAYQRVILLTNRSVDKWPFFDSNWKKMSAKAVKKAGGVELKKNSPNPYNLVAASKEHDANEGPKESTPASSTEQTASSPLFPSDTSSLSDVPISSSDPEGMTAMEHSGAVLATTSKDLDGANTNDPASPASSSFATNFPPLSAFTWATTAASAEPIKTNLDKYPRARPSMSLVKGKRKSEAPVGQCKKLRVAARKREANKNDFVCTEVDADEEESLANILNNHSEIAAEKLTKARAASLSPRMLGFLRDPGLPPNESPQQHGISKLFDTPGLPAQTRTSDSLALNDSPTLIHGGPPDPQNDPMSPKASALTAVSSPNSMDEMDVDVAYNKPTRATAGAPIRTSTPAPPATMMMKQYATSLSTQGGDGTINVPPPVPRHSATPITTKPKVNANSTNNTPGSSFSSPSCKAIAFFARINTRNGVREIPLSSDLFTGEKEMMHRYAEWKMQEDQGMDLNFEQFVKIFGFASKVK